MSNEAASAGLRQAITLLTNSLTNIDTRLGELTTQQDSPRKQDEVLKLTTARLTAHTNLVEYKKQWEEECSQIKPSKETDLQKQEFARKNNSYSIIRSSYPTSIDN